MILRRVIAHVKAQNWTAVFLDFAIVVIGVFLGLQAQQWSSARADRAREADHLEAVAGDLRRDVAEIEEIVRVSTVRMAALEALLSLSPGGALPNGLKSARGLIEIEKTPPFDEREQGSAGVAIFILTTFEGNRSAFETMINTGGLGLVRNASLLAQIQDYYATAAAIRDFEASLKENRVRLVDAQQEAGASPVDETPVAELAGVFGGDARLAAAAKNYWLYTNRHIKLMRDLRDKAEALLRRIESDQR
jgi:hypothetical protein